MGEQPAGSLCVARVGSNWIDSGTLVLTQCSPPGPAGQKGSGHPEALDKSLSPGLRHMLHAYGIHVTDAVVTPPGGRLPATKERQLCVLQQETCHFVVRDNPNASSKAPWYERPEFSQVKQFDKEIERVGKLAHVDARLIRAIIYVETTHGYYSYLVSWARRNQSIRPMKVNIGAWGSTFGTRVELDSPIINLLAGATIIKGIIAALPADAPVSHIATLYNNLNATQVTDYGARVAEVYAEKTWENGR